MIDENKTVDYFVVETEASIAMEDLSTTDNSENNENNEASSGQ